jgi:hypothetical protein
MDGAPGKVEPFASQKHLSIIFSRAELPEGTGEERIAYSALPIRASTERSIEVSTA